MASYLKRMAKWRSAGEASATPRRRRRRATKPAAKRVKSTMENKRPRRPARKGDRSMARKKRSKAAAPKTRRKQKHLVRKHARKGTTVKRHMSFEEAKRKSVV